MYARICMDNSLPQFLRMMRAMCMYAEQRAALVDAHACFQRPCASLIYYYWAITVRTHWNLINLII